MTDREVMQMALRKLEQLRLTVDSEWGSCRDLIEIDAAGEQWPEVIALRARLAEPEPEPVLWLVGGVVQSSDIPADYTGCLYARPINPPTRRPLTDEEIDALWRVACEKHSLGTTGELVRAFARAALKEAK